MPAPRPVWPPTPGFYLVRLVKNGPFVGAQIICADGQWSAMLDGVTSGPVDDPVLLEDIEKIHTYGRESTESEVAYRIGFRRWAEINKPDHPAANPRRAIDPDTLVPF